MSHPQPTIPFNRLETIAAALQSFHREQDAPQHLSSGRTATPPIGVRLTLRITLIPTPTGWAVSLSEHFPDTPSLPTPRHRMPSPSPTLLRGGNRTLHSPSPRHRQGNRDNPARYPDTTHRRRRTTPDDYFGSTSRLENSRESPKRFRYSQQTHRLLNRRLNHRHRPTHSSLWYPIRTRSNTPTTRTSRSSGRHVRFNSPPSSHQSRHRHHRDKDASCHKGTEMQTERGGGRICWGRKW